MVTRPTIAGGGVLENRTKVSNAFATRVEDSRTEAVTYCTDLRAKCFHVSNELALGLCPFIT